MGDPENNEAEETQRPETLSISGSGVTSQPTIGSTTISSSEEQWIRNEVRKIMGQKFPGIQIPSSSATVPTPAIAGQKTSGIEGMWPM